jgi:peptidoglycan/LPS O-acetylase OafA/YrhL
VEEHFYLFLPLLLLVLLAMRGAGTLKAVPWIGLALMIGCTACRLLTVREPVEMHNDQWPTHLRMDSLFFGVTLGYLHHFRPEILRQIAAVPVLLFLACAALVAPMAIYPFHEHLWIRTIGYTMLYVGYGGILVAFLYSRNALLEICTRTWFARAIAFVGIYSYSIYLWHNDAGAHDLVTAIAGKGTGSFYWVSFTILYAAVAVGMGIAMGLLIEYPTLKLRNRLFPTRVRAA